MNARTKLGIAAGLIAVAAGLGWTLLRSGSAGTAAAEPAATDAVSALVRTEVLQKQVLPTQIVAYGEVTPGKVEAVNFPRAGQVRQLLVVQGQTVQRGAPLATLVSDPNAQLAYDQAAHAVDFAQGELKRSEALLALQLATQSQVDGARKALRDAQANLAAQRRLGGQLGTATVTAPFDGVVTALAVAQGDRIQPGATILQLGHADALLVRLGIEPDDSRQVRAGMPVALAPVQDERQTLHGTIAMVQGLVDAKTQLIDAMVTLPADASRSLAPGMRVRATIETGRHEAWVLPRQAVLTDDRGAYVFQVAGGKAHRVNVTQGQQAGERVAIRGPIDPKLPVVVLGNYELQDGMRVREGAR